MPRTDKPNMQTSLNPRQSAVPGSQVFGDLVPVKASVLDKNLVSPVAGHDHAGQINSGNIAFQTLRVEDRLAVAAFDPHSERGQKVEVWMIPGHRKDIVIRNGDPSSGR